MGCTALEEIELPDGIDEIRSHAFYGCTALKRVKLPNTLEFIGRRAFALCVNLEPMNFPDTLRYISRSAFEQVTWFKQMFEVNEPVIIGCKYYKCPTDAVTAVIPEHVKIIEKNAFAGCKKLKSVVFSKKLNSIGAYAFAECSSLGYIEIPNEIEEIGERAFCDCSSLKSIKIPQYMLVWDRFNIANIFSGCPIKKKVLYIKHYVYPYGVENGYYNIEI